MDTQLVNSFGWLLSAGVIALVVFLIGRQFVLWYFRINQIADDLHIIAQHYRAQREPKVGKEYSAHDQEEWRQAQAIAKEWRDREAQRTTALSSPTS